MDYVVANSAVWNDDAVCGALDSAAFWVKGLPFVKSLSGYWKFFLAPSPNSVPVNFHDSAYLDSEWETLPGTCMSIDGNIHVHLDMDMYIPMHTNTYTNIVLYACLHVYKCIYFFHHYLFDFFFFFLKFDSNHINIPFPYTACELVVMCS